MATREWQPQLRQATHRATLLTVSPRGATLRPTQRAPLNRPEGLVKTQAAVGPRGTPVKIRGRNLLAVKSVKFGGKVDRLQGNQRGIVAGDLAQGRSRHTGDDRVDIHRRRTRRGKLTLKGALQPYTKAT